MPLPIVLATGDTLRHLGRMEGKSHLGIGVAAGIFVGVALGIFIGNVIVGMGVGIALGAVVGFALDRLRKG